jgi:nucleotide-binding universal stress UspA family protein
MSPEPRVQTGASPRADGFSRIVAPTDFSSAGEAAWTTALRAARGLGAEVVLVHVVVDTPRFAEGTGGTDLRATLQEARQWAEREAGERVSAARAAGVSARSVVLTGVPQRQILDVATAEGADLIVIGTHGRGGLERALLGSVADHVIRLAPCPVLSVRAPE